MSLLIEGMKMPQHAAVNGEKDTVYRCAILAHADNSVDLVMDAAFASAYDNGHNIQRYPITEIPTPHGRLIDADELIERIERFRDIHNYYPADIDATMRWFINQICGAKTIIGAELGKEANEVKKYRDYLASDTYAVCKRIENGEVSEK